MNCFIFLRCNVKLSAKLPQKDGITYGLAIFFRKNLRSGYEAAYFTALLYAKWCYSSWPTGYFIIFTMGNVV